LPCWLLFYAHHLPSSSFCVISGGWCFDTTSAGTIKNCAGRAMGGGGSSNGMGASMNVGGLLSSDPAVNPHFSNYSLVFMHYCDGTSFSGNATLPVTVPSADRLSLESPESLYRDGFARLTNAAPQEIYFRGRANLRALWWYLDTQLGMAGATDIILSGGSAGATAAYFALDAAAAWVPSTTRLVGAPDAGFFLDAYQVSSNTTWYRDCFIAADPVWNTTGSGGVNADCLAVNPTETWRCFLQQYAAQFIKTPLMILNSAYDQWQILNDLGLGCVPSMTGHPVAGVPSCNAAQMAVFQQYRLTQLTAVAPVLSGYPHNGAFIDSCFVHEQNVDYCSGQSLPNCGTWMQTM
jgi:O-palmitoleoyl-L-serine hydrolase